MKKEFFIQHRDKIIPVFFFLLLLGISFFVLPEYPLWITDNGNKYMMVRQFLLNNTPFFTHLEPALFPYGGFHFQQLASGKIVSFHPVYLPFLSSWCVRFLGISWVNLIPMLCGAAMVWLTMQFRRKDPVPLILLAGTTVLIFYSLLQWEMVPAALAVLASGYCFYKKRTVFAGLFFGCGVWMREELYLLGAILVIVLAIRRSWREIFHFGCGAGVPVLLLWLTNWQIYGNILGIHGSDYFSNNRGNEVFGWGTILKDSTFNCYQHLLRFETLGKFSKIAVWFAVIPALVAGMAPGFKAWSKFKVAAGVVFTANVALLTVGLWHEKSLLFTSAVTMGFFISMPGLLGMMLNWRAMLFCRNRNISLASWVLFIFIFAIPPLMNMHDIGLTWGARHYIVVSGIAVLLGCYAWRASGLMMGRKRLLFTGVIMLGVSMQLWGLTALKKVAGDSAAVEKILLAKKSDMVITDLFFIPEMTPGIMSEKIVLEVASEAQYRILPEFLQRNKKTSFTLILSPRYRRMSNEFLAGLLSAYPVQRPPEKMVIGNSLEIFIADCQKR